MLQEAVLNVRTDGIYIVSTGTNRCDGEHLTKDMQFGMGNGSVLESLSIRQINKIDPAIRCHSQFLGILGVPFD